MALIYIVYDVQTQSGKILPSLLGLLLFEMIWNAEDQNNQFDKP